ncbi:MAG TPA: hypothetical protein VK717_08110, partial [Opitutaceae bacterium]|nr:hypothetical protein [Opitutaceae bacterium]
AQSAKREPEPTEVGDADKRVNQAEVVAGKDEFGAAGYPCRGEGCGETRLRGIFVKESPDSR